MDQSLSIWSLIGEASFLVQIVLLLLFSASVISWLIIFQRMSIFRKADSARVDFEQKFWSGMDLTLLYRQSSAQPNQNSGLEMLFKAGYKEFTRLRQQSHADPDAVMEGTQRAMRVALSRESDRLETHLSFLATVGSTSPYVGLFGTVWGIMNSFRGLAHVHQATLASVAPGISEALVATAMGLLAAIPAVVAYNRYAAKSERLINAYETFSDEFISILHRKVHASHE